jgi:uncharacterized protein (TIGR02646 family)
MRHIRKRGNGTVQLQNKDKNPPNTSAEATTLWRSLKKKDVLIDQLLEEQFHLCCYSEIRADLHKIGWHIEHLENKSQAPARTFKYDNLAASAFSSDDLGKKKFRGKVFGGHTPGKQGTVNVGMFISPAQADCARFFAFLSDGRITPAMDLPALDEARAVYTITLLNLDSSTLKAKRKLLWDDLQKVLTKYGDQEADLRKAIAADLAPGTDGRLNEFFSLARQFFGAHAEACIRAYAPTLA